VKVDWDKWVDEDDDGMICDFSLSVDMAKLSMHMTISVGEGYGLQLLDGNKSLYLVFVGVIFFSAS
jgi:hypothetical protein